MQKDYSKEIGQKVWRQGVSQVGKSYFSGEKEFFPFILSNTALDSDNEVVDIPSANLKRFLDNSVGFFQHESYKLPILTWHNVRIEGNALIADAHFHELPDENGNPLSKTIKEYVKAGVLKAVSIGFRYTDMPEQVSVDGKTIWIIKEPEIFEASIVTIPANPEALIIEQKIKAMGIKAGAVLSKKNRALIETIKSNAETILSEAEPSEDGKAYDDDDGITDTALSEISDILKGITAELVRVKHELADLKKELTATPSQTASEQLEYIKENQFITLKEYLDAKRK
jgi:HK97 family phage prohead protease